MYRSSCFLAFACGVLWIIVTGKHWEATCIDMKLWSGWPTLWISHEMSWTFLILCHIQRSIMQYSCNLDERFYAHIDILSSCCWTQIGCSQHNILLDLINSWNFSSCRKANFFHFLDKAGKAVETVSLWNIEMIQLQSHRTAAWQTVICGNWTNTCLCFRLIMQSIIWWPRVGWKRQSLVIIPAFSYGQSFWNLVKKSACFAKQ